MALKLKSDDSETKIKKCQKCRSVRVHR